MSSVYLLQFGVYIMFPIAWMYYFGTNLENRFSVPDFWPKPEATHRIPFEKEEIQSELQRLRERRLERRAKRIDGVEGMDREEDGEGSRLTVRGFEKSREDSESKRWNGWWKG